VKLDDGVHAVQLVIKQLAGSLSAEYFHALMVFLTLP
jgi:hypothetical protein